MAINKKSYEKPKFTKRTYDKDDIVRTSPVETNERIGSFKVNWVGGIDGNDGDE